MTKGSLFSFLSIGNLGAEENIRNQELSMVFPELRVRGKVDPNSRIGDEQSAKRRDLTLCAYVEDGLKKTVEYFRDF